jgi:SAM-dependent methyltransferase
VPEASRLAPPSEIDRSGAPIVPETDVPRCEVCGRDDFVDAAYGYDYELITCRNEWRFVRCSGCGHIWLNPRPADEALAVIYPSSYYAYNYETISPLARRGKEFLDRRKLGKILSYCAELPKTYLDVGCGDGRYLEVMARRGVDRRSLYGLELDAETVSLLQQRGLQVSCQRVENCDFDEGSFDLITMFHVIEHVDHPREVVQRLARWLRPGGVLALETPNTDSLDARLFREGTWGGYHIPRHWHLFNPEAFRTLVRSTGLDVEALRYETGHSFWMYSFHHVIRYGRRPRIKLATAFDPLKSVVPLIGFTGFDRLRSMLGAKTSAMLLIAKKPAS